MPNSSSKRITNSTVSSESAPRSSMNRAFGVTSFSSTPNSSTIICFTFCSISGSGIRLLLFQNVRQTLVCRLCKSKNRLVSPDDKLKFVGQYRLTSSAQTNSILDIDATYAVINLAQQPAQNFSGSNFYKALYTVTDQEFN